MKKLELKDIVSYLPYNLSIYYECKNDDTDDGIYKLDSIDLSLKGDESLKFKGSLEMYHIYHCKPILHPMTDLVKPIVVEGYNNDEEFVPLVEIVNKRFYPRKYNVKSETELKVWYKGNYIEYDNMMLYTNEYGSCVYPVYMDYVEFIDLLNQWHFDYKYLISQGLAIDINILKKE